MKEQLKTSDLTIGVVGLGLMGNSIIVSLLLAGHRVIGIAPISGEKEVALPRIKNLLKLCKDTSLLKTSWESYLPFLTISDNYDLLAHCDLVFECVIEKIEVKEVVYKKITSATYPDTIIASNTSAIPISSLQQFVAFPEKFIGIHWAEPAFATRFMEITCGDQTSAETAEWVYDLALRWGKEPTLLKKDIKGFITNRLMYAVYREMFAVIEEGSGTIEDVDKAFRYDAGSWMTLMGIFRRMDFLGLKDFSVIFETVFPKLNNSDVVPVIMQHLVGVKASGTRGHKGLYNYTSEEARNWKYAFEAFNKDIFRLAALYPFERRIPILNGKGEDIA